MAKSRKKKNYKLRRRVMRTIAALTMVMAVVVAAIPVENYGTMQASGVDGVNLKADAEAFLLSNGAVKDPLYDPNDPNDSGNEGSYKDAVKTAQHIEGDSFIDAYEITLKANSYDAMISKSVFEADIDKFDIYEEEYYDYICPKCSTKIFIEKGKKMPSMFCRKCLQSNQLTVLRLIR